MDDAVTARTPARRDVFPRARRTVIAVVGILGVLGSLLAFHTVREGARGRLETQFRQRAYDRIQTIERELNAGVVLVESIAAYLHAEPAVDRARFRTFTEPLLTRYSSIRALSYNRRVMGAEREAHEAAARLEGAGNYRITEPFEGGVRVAGDRAEYVAVRYIEPRADNERALGLDIAVEPVRREALDRARTTGHAAMTGSVALVQERGRDAAGVLICVPVRGPGNSGREEITGFAIGVFQVGELVEAAMTHLEPAGIDVRLIDTTTRPGRLLHLHSSRTRTEPAVVEPERATVPEGLHETATLEHAGRRWTIVCEPTEVFLAGMATPWSIIVLVSGLMVTALLVTALSRLTRLGARLQREILERERNQLAYEVLVDNAPVCIHELDLDGRLIDMNPAGLKMIGASDRSDIRGLRYVDGVTESDRARVKAMLDRAITGAACEFEFGGGGAKMKGRVFATILMPGRAEDGSICKLIGVSQDITARRRAAAALKANQIRLELLHTIATSVSPGMPRDDVIAAVVQHASKVFPSLRIAYSTVDTADVLTVLKSVEPPGMQPLRGLTVDLTRAPSYLNTLRRGAMLRVDDVAEEPRLGALADDMAARGTRAHLHVPLPHSDELLGVLGLDAPMPHEWTEHEVRTLQEIAEHLRVLLREALIERKRSHAVEALRVSEARQAVILRSAPIVLYVARGDDRGITWLSEQVSNVAGFAPARFIEEPDLWVSRIHPDDRERTTQAMDDAIAGGQVTTEYRWKRADGSYRWFRDQSVLVRDDGGRPVEIIGTWIDVSEHKWAERRQTLMMRELDHRVKNNLASVLALAEQSLAASPSLEAFREAFAGRIRALVRTHEVLASARWEGIQLERVVLLTLAPYCGRNTELTRIDGPPVMLPARASTPVCMVLHELATNAAKYGSVSEPTGAIDVSWTSDDGGNLKLLWIEAGGPPVAADPTPGYGLSLIKGLIAHELRGTIDLRFESTGLVCTIAIPAASLQVDAARLDDQRVPEKASAR